VDQRFELNAVSNVERTNTFRRIELMSGNGQEVDTELVHPRRNLADRLGSVGMEGDAMLARYRYNIREPSTMSVASGVVAVILPRRLSGSETPLERVPNNDQQS
jgi:hypothetical protein